jgi:hypothetical protein
MSLASSADSIMVAAATYTENLSISISLKVIGSGATTTIVDGGGAGTVFTISSGTANVTLSNFTIRHGSGGFSGGGVINDGTLTINSSTISGNGGNYGGGIRNSGTLRIHHSTISNNIGAFTGGGIGNSGTLTITDSTVSGNLASVGGGISNNGALRINNSTLSGNSAIRHCAGHFCYGGNGGAVFSLGGHLTINNGTLSGNSAGLWRGGIYNGPATATLQNSIVANNSGGNCYGTMTSKGYNIDSDGTCNLFNSGDRSNNDPMLGPLQNNGGPTQTLALLPGSPAIDAGNPSGCTDGSGHLLTTDQRGYPRHDPEDTSGCDMGAYDSQSD